MKNKKYTPKQKRVIEKYWKLLQEYLDIHYNYVRKLETGMQMDTGIDDIEFIVGCDGNYCGVGTMSRSHKLIQF